MENTESLSLESLFQTVKSALSIFSENPLIQAVVVVILSLAVAKLSDLIITRVAKRLVQKTSSEIDDQLIGLLHRPIFVTMLLLGLLFALLLVSPSEYVRWAGVALIKTLVVLIWVIFAIRVTTMLLVWMSQDRVRIRAVQPATRPLFETLGKLLILALGVYFILISWGVNPVGWIASAGIAAVAIGLAAQETLGNLFSGISILADSPYKLGDYIVLEGQDRGKVTKIGLRSTSILTRDDLEVTVPNSVIARSKIINETSGRWIKQRLRIPVGVAYGSNIDQVKQILLRATQAQEGVSKTPNPWVKFDGFGDSSLNLEIRVWIDDPAMRGRVTDAINSEVYRSLAESGVEIPFPKRDLYIKELPKKLAKRLSTDSHE